MLMQMGFLLLESGIVRSKNSINVAAKNLIDLSIVLMIYWVIGFGIMFGASHQGWMGTSFFMIADFNVPPFASFFLFQAMFCATATTIVSGAIAERGSLHGYIAITFLLSGLIYPAFGHWVWASSSGISESSGWLQNIGFIDFAGSTVVHSTGGWVALAAIIIIGPRIGRFDNDDFVFRPYNLVHSVAGVILLFIGWMGFNTGSNLNFSYEILSIMLNTAMAGAAGGVVAIILSSYLLKSMEVLWICNGILAGLVSVTASCNIISIPEAVLIGGIGSIVCITCMRIMDRLKLDDVVHAVPVHLGAGIWGTLAVALFGDLSVTGNEEITRSEQLLIQITGISICAVWAFGSSFLLLHLINRFIPLRVPAKSEIDGLNIVEHNASNEMHDLIYAMQQQEADGNFESHVKVEPSTEISQIATQYNRILDRFNQATREIYEQHTELEKITKSLSKYRLN